MSGRRIVILGASGFLGSHLSAQAERHEFEVVRPSSKEINLCRPESVSLLAALLRERDVLVHSAAIAPARNAADTATNLTMTHNLVCAAEKIRLAQVLIVSSDAVYGSASGVVNEGTACTPDSPHGIMSLGRELACAEIASDVLTIVRASPVYGVRDTHNSYGPNRFARQALHAGQMTLLGEGKAARDHVSIIDVASILWRCISERQDGTINVASGAMRSFAQVAEIVRGASSGEVLVTHAGSESRPTYRSFDITNLVRRFPNHVPTLPENGIAHLTRVLAAQSS